MKTKNLPIFKVIVKPDSKEFKFKNVDPVLDGAIEREWLALSKSNSFVNDIQLATDKAKYLTYAPVLIPDRLIYRKDQNTGYEYFIMFDGENIINALKSIKRNKAEYNIQLDHEGKLINNIYPHELWIVDDPEMDKSKHLGLKDIPKNTLMASHDWSEAKDIYNEMVLTGKLNGYSIQARLEHEFTQYVEVPIIEKLSKEKEQITDELNILEMKLQLKELEIKLQNRNK